MSDQLLSLTLIFVGGGSGSLLRYFVGLVPKLLWGQPSLWATCLINLLGSLLIGYLAGRLAGPSELISSMRDLLIIGFCGGFTTYSTFSLDLLTTLRSGHYTLALGYLALSLLGGLLFVALGFRLGSHS